jgi:hypothetical protein
LLSTRLALVTNSLEVINCRIRRPPLLSTNSGYRFFGRVESE